MEASLPIDLEPAAPGTRASIPWWVFAAGVACALVPLGIMAAAARAAPASGGTFMGELQYDQFYYLACARELFERGNGFAYPNPYDPRLTAPIIYSHLYPLLIGWVWRLTPLSLLQVDYLVRVLAGTALTAGLWRLTGLLFEDSRQRTAVFWTTLVGGGVSWLEALRRLATAGDPWNWTAFSRLHRSVEAFDGAWFQNVQRNYLYATETLYHALVFWLLWSLAARRRRLACVLLALLLYAHPFTGAQFALVTLLWIGGEKLARREPLFEGTSLVMIGLGAVFVLYNLWLARFPEHVEVVRFWRLVSVALPAAPYLWMYGPWIFALPSALWVLRNEWLAPGPWRLVALVLAVTLVLMNNHLWLRPLGAQPVQPIHFAHGYEFFPMVFFTFRWLFRPGHAPRFGGFLARALRSQMALAVLVIVFALDNLAFLPRVFGLCLLVPQTVPRENAEILARLETIEPPTLVLTSWDKLGYLVPTFTPHHSVLGHFALTPLPVLELVGQLKADAGPLLRALPDIGLVAVSATDGQALEAQGVVRPGDLLLVAGDLRLYRRTPAATPPSS